MQIKLRHYHTSGADKGNVSHETIHYSIRGAMLAYIEACESIPKYQALEPTIWAGEGDNWRRLTWSDVIEGMTLEEVYNEIIDDYRMDIIFLYESVIIDKVSKIGGFREKNIIKNLEGFAVGHTWNDEHKVVKIFDSNLNSFDFDLETMTICG